jgi:cell division protein FtsL
MAMRPNIQVRVYRPRQIMFDSDKPRYKKRGSVLLPANQCKLLGLLAVAACIGGLVLTHALQVRVADLRTKADQLQASYTAFTEENKRLVATEAQLASKTQVVALATRKLKLYEPGHSQIRRM